MRKLTLAFLVLLPAICSAAGPKIIAHRGYWQTDGSAQNSIRSLIKADSIGCYGSEFDVWLTADNQLVVNHNRDINGRDIETGLSSDLLAEHLPNGEFMPTLSQYLDAGRPLSVEMILEVKPHRDPAREDIAVPMIINMVEQKGLTDRTTYITFSRHAFDLLVQQSGRPVYFLTAIDPDSLRAAGGAGPDYHISHFRKNPRWRNEFRQMGMPVNVWTIANEADMRYCIEHDVDFVTTDIPEVALRMAAEAHAPRPVSMLTYNLHAGADASVDSIAAVILAANPDFVALQEVDAYTRRANARQHNGQNFIARLAAATNMFPLYGRTLNFVGGYYGIGLLSRHPIVDSQVIELPNPNNVEPRILLEATAMIDGTRPVTVASTHLCVESEPTRVLQADYIAKRYASPLYPVILGGDFNSEPTSEPIAIFDATMQRTGSSEPTFPALDPDKKLDYVYSAGSVRPLTIQVMRPGDKPESDHRAVLVTLLLDGDEPADGTAGR